MRCYFMREGHIVSVEFLDSQDDAGRIAQSKKLFDSKAKSLDADGFEVWDGARFVYRFPERAMPSR
ncbi:MAG TPA: hypothetical protein VN723_02075 [Rhizomicrobium sp.]|jgi:hypothetical protein|nr:hypothetical protein [Rhizomicrobium sp.]